jgi:predicted lipoprotein with Yx(FWY)xxD motif
LISFQSNTYAKSHVRTVRTASTRDATNYAIETTKGDVGTYLSVGGGYALYQSKGDAPDVSNCSGDCIKNWPPLIIPSDKAPVAGDGVNQSLIGTIKRADGNTQVTYNKLPLYGYVKDEKSGDHNGQGLNDSGNVWYLVSPSGVPLLPSQQGSLRDSNNPTANASPSPCPSPSPHLNLN